MHKHTKKGAIFLLWNHWNYARCIVRTGGCADKCKHSKHYFTINIHFKIILWCLCVLCGWIGSILLKVSFGLSRNSAESEQGWPLQWVCIWKQKPGKYKGWSVGLLLTILTALNVRYSMVKVMTSIMLSNCLGSGSSEHRVKESKDSPGGSRGWQISSTASSTFLVAGQSSPGCHHWIGPPLKYMMEIADVQHKTQWNTVFAKLARHMVWCITAGYLIMVFFLS